MQSTLGAKMPCGNGLAPCLLSEGHRHGVCRTPHSSFLLNKLIEMRLDNKDTWLQHMAASCRCYAEDRSADFSHGTCATFRQNWMQSPCNALVKKWGWILQDFVPFRSPSRGRNLRAKKYCMEKGLSTPTGSQDYWGVARKKRKPYLEPTDAAGGRLKHHRSSKYVLRSRLAHGLDLCPWHCSEHLEGKLGNSGVRRSFAGRSKPFRKDLKAPSKGPQL